MMSKERELLQRVFDTQHTLSVQIAYEIEELLAQPENINQGFVIDLETLAAAVHDAYIDTCNALGWSIKPENRVHYSELTENSKELDRASVRAVLRLITSPPKREPLSDVQIWWANSNPIFEDGVRFAEKHYKIEGAQ
jgi:hypothetical protein